MEVCLFYHSIDGLVIVQVLYKYTNERTQNLVANANECVLCGGVKWKYCIKYDNMINININTQQ